MNLLSYPLRRILAAIALSLPAWCDAHEVQVWVQRHGGVVHCLVVQGPWCLSGLQHPANGRNRRPSWPTAFFRAVRGHWAVENRLHWVLDVSFGEDASTVRKDNAPQNLSLLKKIVLNLIRLDTTDQKKTSLRLKRKAAAWDDDFRVKIMGLIRL